MGVDRSSDGSGYDPRNVTSPPRFATPSAHPRRTTMARRFPTYRLLASLLMSGVLVAACGGNLASNLLPSGLPSFAPPSGLPSFAPPSGGLLPSSPPASPTAAPTPR